MTDECYDSKKLGFVWDGLGVVRELSDVTIFFCFNDTATTEIYTLSLHDALPIWIDFANSTLSSAMAMKEASGTSVPRERVEFKKSIQIGRAHV